METDRLTDRMGSVPILPIKRTITKSTMLNFDGDGDGHGDGDGDGDGTCKQTFTLPACLLPLSKKTFCGNSMLTTQSEFNTIMINRPYSCYFECVWETAMYLNVYITNLLLLPTSISNQPKPPLYMETMETEVMEIYLKRDIKGNFNLKVRQVNVEINIFSTSDAETLNQNCVVFRKYRTFNRSVF